MVCLVWNFSGLTKVEIHRESAAAGTIQTIASITPDNRSVNTSRIKLKTGTITSNSAIVRLNFANQVACEDSGQYHCTVTGERVSNATLKLDLLRKPSKPSLTLSRDMVEGKENRADLPFICEGDVGFPAGKLVLDSNFTSNFYPYIANINTTISEKTCQAYQKVTFYYAFSRDWHGKEIRCSAVNYRSLRQNEIPPFDKQSVEVVPASYCPNLERRLYYHPYNCKNYIDCVDGKVHVGLCPETLCFGVHETNRCNYCTNTSCVTDIIDDVCHGSSAQLVPYTSSRCSMYVNCTERLVHDCPQNKCFDVLNKICPSWIPFLTELNCSVTNNAIGSNATILCAVGGISITSVRATVRPCTGGEIGLSYVTGVNGPGVLERNLKATLALSGIGPNQTLSLEIHHLQRNQTGQYIINVNSNIGGRINLTDKADVPAITVPNIIIENGTLEIRCRGHVGTPAKQIFLEVQFHGSRSFQTFFAENKTNITSTEKYCYNERETLFAIFATSYWNNGTVRCSVRNDDNSILSSDQQRIIVVKSTISFEPSKREAYIGDNEFSMTCNVSSHQYLRRVEIYYESATLGTKEIIANVEPQSTVTYRKGIILSEAAFMEDNANVTIGFTYNLTCNDDGMYHCIAVGTAIFISSIKLIISSEPKAPTLTLSPWIEENKPIFADRMFRCDGMVGKPEGLVFVEANISGSFERYHFPSVIENTEVNCNTKQSYQFYYTFNMSWLGRDIRCAVKNAKTNEIIRSPPKTIEVVRENYCVGKGDYEYYPHPYECTKYIGCNQGKIVAISFCGPGLCWGVNQTIGCTYCHNQSGDLTCLPGARKD
ncbi:hypothetical protein CHS0354_041819 [Potamilus streckersoni]|uniref:Chitin-binding type-2 domain-containing protein n=1 Tax=Potamilus streckersoni TaxID=2493646 RepID=A0AAE0T1I9_9BIVA|nr:hypothetical protein CHS0354_041819 [Potamilus streckersoni]